MQSLKPTFHTYILWRLQALFQQSPGRSGIGWHNLSRQQRLGPCPDPRAPARIHLHLRPHQRHPAWIDLEKAAASFGGQFHAGVNDQFGAGVVVDFVAGFDEVAGADLDVLIVGDGQVVVGLDLGFAVGMGGAVFFGQQFGVAVGFDAVVAFVADADVLIVLDLLVPVALGVDEDLFFTSLVFDAQFVEAVATGAAEGFEDAAGLVLR